MFLSKNKKNRQTPENPSFSTIKVGFKGVHISRTCFPDADKVCPGKVCKSKTIQYVLAFVAYLDG